MKGVFVIALIKMVQDKFGNDKMEASLQEAKMDKELMVLPISDVDDRKVMQLILSVSKVLNKTITELADVFGDYWINEYAQTMYPAYFTGVKTAKDFILKMDLVHFTTTKNIPNARPPRFDFSWVGEKTLIIKYTSMRGMIDFMIGLIKGVGIHYKEELKVTKIGEDKVEIIFQ
jgi:hypothetical protein